MAKKIGDDPIERINGIVLMRALDLEGSHLKEARDGEGPLLQLGYQDKDSQHKQLVFRLSEAIMLRRHLEAALHNYSATYSENLPPETERRLREEYNLPFPSDPPPN